MFRRHWFTLVAALSTGLASAAPGDMPTALSFDFSDSRVVVGSVLAVGVAIVTGMTVFVLGRRAADAIADEDDYQEYLDHLDRE